MTDAHISQVEIYQFVLKERFIASGSSCIYETKYSIKHAERQREIAGFEIFVKNIVWNKTS